VAPAAERRSSAPASTAWSLPLLTFTFFLLDGPRTVPEFLIDEFPSSDAALEFARDLLSVRRAYDAVEIVQGETRIATLKRESRVEV
jgi:hypothetical protein